ncbi:MAG: hypothetical protein N3F06_02625, partial [Nitrososphaerales archaeon]|nr:hypothetical protein [Nitrososphaerales archaeon]
ANMMWRRIAGKEGLNILDKMTIIELGHRPSMEQVVTGAIDAYFLVGFPNPTVAEFCVKYKLKLVPPSKEELDIISKIPIYTIKRLKVTEKEYPGINIEYDTPSMFRIVAVRAEIPEDVVYKIVKAYWENLDKAALIFPEHKNFKPEDTFGGKIPLHPGVVRYFREIGIKIPDEFIPPELKR